MTEQNPAETSAPKTDAEINQQLGRIAERIVTRANKLVAEDNISSGSRDNFDTAIITPVDNSIDSASQPSTIIVGHKRPPVGATPNAAKTHNTTKIQKTTAGGDAIVVNSSSVGGRPEFDSRLTVKEGKTSPMVFNLGKRQAQQSATSIVREARAHLAATEVATRNNAIPGVLKTR